MIRRILTTALLAIALALPYPADAAVSGICATNAPKTQANAQAWVTKTSPKQNSNQTVCGSLLVKGKAQAGVAVTVTMKYKSTSTSYTGVTNSAGVAPVTFGIGRAAVGFKVNVTVKFKTGQVAYTSFTPVK